jgi:hypothetical protein
MDLGDLNLVLELRRCLRKKACNIRLGARLTPL